MRKREILYIAFFIILLIILILLVGCSTKNKNNSLLIGTWTSDWRPEMDLSVLEFSKDGTVRELIINKEVVKNTDDITDLENSAEEILNYTYKDYGNYFELISKEKEETIKVEYKIENNKLKLTLNQAGYRYRGYEKVK